MGSNASGKAPDYDIIGLIKHDILRYLTHRILQKKSQAIMLVVEV